MGFLEHLFQSDAGIILVINREPDAAPQGEVLDIYAGPLGKLQKYSGDYLFSKTPRAFNHQNKRCGVYIEAADTDSVALGALIWDHNQHVEMYYEDGHAERLTRLDPRELPRDLFARLNIESPARKRPRLGQAVSANHHRKYCG